MCKAYALCAGHPPEGNLALKHSLRQLALKLLPAEPAGGVVKASACLVHARMTEGELLRAVLRNCLAHVLPNAIAVADASDDPEHLHQLRVGLRRLRTAIRHLSPLVPDTNWALCKVALAQTFRALGDARDQHGVLAPLKRQLMAAGIQDLAWIEPGGPVVDPVEVVQRPEFLTALADVQVFVLGFDQRAHSTRPAHKQGLTAPLAKLHVQVCREGRRFHALSLPEQHRVRKRLKRLRYLSEFVAPLFPSKGTERYTASLRLALDSLGLCNDLAVAGAVAQAAAERGHAGAVLAMDWLARARKTSAQHCERDLRLVAETPVFWSSPAADD
jgi:CHAD domain-containing protein